MFLAENAPEHVPERPIGEEHVEDLLGPAMPPRMPLNLASWVWIPYICMIGIIFLPGCTSELCETKCLEFADGRVLKYSHCKDEDHCECVFAPHGRHALAAAEDHNGTFV
jgi:hypothetical protein